LSAFSPDHPAVPLASAGALLVLLVATLTASGIIRRRYQTVGTVVYARRPWVFVLFALMAVITVAVPAFIRFDRDSIYFLLLPLLLGATGSGEFLPTALRAWAAEQDGLTSQVLGWRKTFLWRDIDWAFVHERRTDVREVGIKLLQMKDRFLYVEAGPSRRMKVPISTWLAGDATPLLRAIERRATNAYFGADKRLEVERQRTHGAEV
jgi:hypothetical protein